LWGCNLVEVVGMLAQGMSAGGLNMFAEVADMSLEAVEMSLQASKDR
jgi:hypothetical protein